MSRGFLGLASCDSLHPTGLLPWAIVSNVMGGVSIAEMIVIGNIGRRGRYP